MRRRLLLAVPAALAGCSVLDRPYIETPRFALAPRREPAPPRRAARRVLLARPMRAAAGLDQRGLREIRADGSEFVEPYAEWIAPPAELAEDALRRWLSASGLFAAVVATGSRVRPDLILESELTLLAIDLRAGAARCEIAATVLRDDGVGGRALGQFLSEGRAAWTPATPIDFAARAEAMNQALAGALASLERGLARYA